MIDKRKNNGGARPGAGRKPKSTEEEKIDLITSEIPKEEIIKLCAKQARKGNVKCIELLMYYVFGKPTDKVEQDINLTGNGHFDLENWTKGQK
jgi:hypothetical protein